MHSSIILGTVLPAALAYALPAVETWKAAPTTVECDTQQKAFISLFTPGYTNGTDLAIEVCKNLDPCMYPGSERPADIMCTMSEGISKRSLDRSLSEPKSGSIDVTALDPSNKTPKTLKVELSQPANIGTYRKEDCEGYIAQLFSKQKGSGGCADESTGIHMGSLTVGSPSTLSGAVFKASLLDRKI